MTYYSATTDSAERIRSDLGIVDAHCHLWQIELARQTGLTPDFAPLFRTFSPSDLFGAAAPLGVNACVLIESGKTDAENRALAEMAASSNLVAAFTPHVDLASPTLERELDGWYTHPKFRGVRARFEAHPDPEILTQPNVLNGIAKLAERGLVLEFLVRASHLKHILKIYEKFPRLNAVIEHMAKPDVVAGTDRAVWRSSMRALAAYTPIACKLSLSPRVEQMGELLKTLGNGWPVEAIKPFVGSLLEWFGLTRLMWGSDWPVALLVASYQDTLCAMRAAVGKIRPDEEERLFRTTAIKFYELEAPGQVDAASRTREVDTR